MINIFRNKVKNIKIVVYINNGKIYKLNENINFIKVWLLVAVMKKTNT